MSRGLGFGTHGPGRTKEPAKTDAKQGAKGGKDATPLAFMQAPETLTAGANPAQKNGSFNPVPPPALTRHV